MDINNLKEATRLGRERERKVQLKNSLEAILSARQAGEDIYIEVSCGSERASQIKYNQLENNITTFVGVLETDITDIEALILAL